MPKKIEKISSVIATLVIIFGLFYFFIQSGISKTVLNMSSDLSKIKEYEEDPVSYLITHEEFVDEQFEFLESEQLQEVSQYWKNKIEEEYHIEIKTKIDAELTENFPDFEFKESEIIYPARYQRIYKNLQIYTPETIQKLSEIYIFDELKFEKSEYRGLTNWNIIVLQNQPENNEDFGLSFSQTLNHELWHCFSGDSNENWETENQEFMSKFRQSENCLKVSALACRKDIKGTVEEVAETYSFWVAGYPDTDPIKEEVIREYTKDWFKEAD